MKIIIDIPDRLYKAIHESDRIVLGDKNTDTIIRRIKNGTLCGGFGMNKERKTNIIKALKSEIAWYKRQPCEEIIRETIDLDHLCISSMFSFEEVAEMPKDIIPDLLIRKLTKAFSDNIKDFPIRTSLDEKHRSYRADLDLWVDNSGRRY